MRYSLAVFVALDGCVSDPGHAPTWRVGSSRLVGTIHGGIDPAELPDQTREQVASARAVITETR